MRLLATVFIFILPMYLFSQEEDSRKNKDFVFTPEILVGITAEANSFFPEHEFQKQVMLNFGWNHDNNAMEWAHRLKGPRTGFSLGYANFGNKDSLGIALSLMPFVEFDAFGSKNLNVHIGSGISYFNKIFHPITNPNNQAVSTDLSWSLRASMNYRLIRSENLDWRVGAGFFHHSNGHTRLPNQGYNSFLFSLSADIKNLSKSEKEKPELQDLSFPKSVYSYVSFRSGVGINVLSKVHSDKKGAYTIAGEYGQVFNNTLKLGVGFYYRFYQNYYDYIIDNESLVQDGREFDFFRNDPWRYATNFGLSLKGEVLFNHIGVELQLGFNLHKPAYAIDWRINQGWANVPRIIPENSNIVLGEFDSKYRIKHLVSAHIGLKYYLIGTNKVPKNNFYLGAHINTNLGQADFTELSVGYVYSFNFKER